MPSDGKHSKLGLIRVKAAVVKINMRTLRDVPQAPNSHLAALSDSLRANITAFVAPEMPTGVACRVG